MLKQNIFVEVCVYQNEVVKKIALSSKCGGNTMLYSQTLVVRLFATSCETKHGTTNCFFLRKQYQLCLQLFLLCLGCCGDVSFCEKKLTLHDSRCWLLVNCKQDKRSWNGKTIVGFLFKQTIVVCFEPHPCTCPVVMLYVCVYHTTLELCIWLFTNCPKDSYSNPTERLMNKFTQRRPLTQEQFVRIINSSRSLPTFGEFPCWSMS